MLYALISNNSYLFRRRIQPHVVLDVVLCTFSKRSARRLGQVVWSVRAGGMGRPSRTNSHPAGSLSSGFHPAAGRRSLNIWLKCKIRNCVFGFVLHGIRIPATFQGQQSICHTDLAKGHRVYRVPGFLSSRPNCLSPPPHPQASVARPPFGSRGGGHTRWR